MSIQVIASAHQDGRAVTAPSPVQPTDTGPSVMRCVNVRTMASVAGRMVLASVSRATLGCSVRIHARKVFTDRTVISDVTALWLEDVTP